MAATLTVDFYANDPVDEVALPWRVEWHYGSNVASISCLQPMMEWLEPVDINPDGSVAGLVAVLERMGKVKAQAFIGGE